MKMGSQTHYQTGRPVYRGDNPIKFIHMRKKHKSKGICNRCKDITIRKSEFVTKLSYNFHT